MRGPLPPRVSEEIEYVARPGKADAVKGLLARAMRAYEREDYAEALGPAMQAKGMAPRSSSVREILGLVHYRLGRWRDAARELATYARMSGKRDHDHLRADVERALGHPEHALDILDGLKASEVGEELLVEGLVVAAGALADLGRHAQAVDLLERGPVRPRAVLPYHLRLWYSLADALDNAGRRAEAREWWDLIYAEDPGFFDVESRRLR